MTKLLGLEVLNDADKRLTAQIESTKVTRDCADDERKHLVRAPAGCTDERASGANGLLRKRGGAPMPEVPALAAGPDDEGPRRVAAFRSLSLLDSPPSEDVESAAARLRASREPLVAVAGGLAESAAQRVDVLHAALRLHAQARPP